MGKLTVKRVESAEEGRHGDGQGLYLLVKPSGARSWLLRVQHGGRRRDVGLGAYGAPSRIGELSRRAAEVPLLERRILSLAEAREKAALLRRLAKAGQDPVRERDRRVEAPKTFKEAAVAAHAAQRESWSVKTADAFLSTLTEYAYPMIGDTPVSDVEAKDIASVLGPIWLTKPSTALKVRQHISTVLNVAKASGWRTGEAPRASLKVLLGKRGKTGNMAAMPWADVPAFVADLRGKPESMGRLALLFTIATAARSQEVRLARWSEIDRSKRLWNRPADHMKGKVAHSVTLNDFALGVLDRAAKHCVGDTDGLIFPGKGGATMSDMTLSKLMRDAKQPFVPHGFRSSFRDWAAEKMPTVPDPVAEAALAHAVPDEVVKAYKRTKFVEMRRTLLEAWGVFVTGKNVA